MFLLACVHTKERPFSEGELVFVCNFTTGQKWLAGIIDSINGQSSLTVELTDGRIVCCHVDHVQSHSVPPSSIVSHDNELLDIPSPTDNSAEEAIPAEMPAAETVHVQRRSTQVHRPPDRFNFDTEVN